MATGCWLPVTAGIAGHVGLGLLLTAVVWAAGLAVVLRLPLGQERLRMLFAYPCGLLLCVGWAVLYLAHGWLGLVGAALIVGLLASLGSRAAALAEFMAVGGAISCSAPFAIAAAVFAATELHGPGLGTSSSAGGDLLFFVARAFSAQVSVFPWPSLVVAGEHFTQDWLQSAHPLLSGAASDAFGGDIFLFDAASLTTFVTISTCVCFALVVRETRPAWGANRWPRALVAAPLVVTWPVLSFGGGSPIGLALPLAFSLYVLAHRRLPWQGFVVMVVATALCAALTMVVGLAAVGITAAAGLLRHRYWRTLSARWLLGAGIVLVGLIVVFIVLLLPEFGISKPRVGFDPARNAPTLANLRTENGWRQFAHVLRSAAEPLLLIALIRARAWISATLLAIALLFTWIVFVHDFGVVIQCAFVFGAIVFLADSTAMSRNRALVISSAALMSVSTWLDGSASLRVGLFVQGLFTLAVTAALVMALRPERRASVGLAWRVGALAVLTGLFAMADRPLLGLVVAAAVVAAAGVARRLGQRRSPAVVATSIAVAAGLGVAVSVRAARLGEFALREPMRGALTSDDYTVWQAVRRLVPRHALVFTDAQDNQRFRGFYVAAGHRQVYLGTAEYSYLEDNASKLRLRERSNRLVLNGTLDPSTAPQASGYAGYYAVRQKQEGLPAGARLLYSNGTYDLVRLKSSA